MRTRNMLLVLIGCGLFVTGAVAQDIDITRHPGYVDLEKIEIPEDAGSITDIDLGPALLRLAFWAEEEFDVNEDLTKSLSGLLSVRIKSFDIGYRESEDMRSMMEKLEKRLMKDKWENLVRVRGEDEIMNISLKTVRNKIVGFFMMSLEEGDQVAFANIVASNIDLSSIRKLGMGLGEAGLDSLWQNLDEF